MTFFHMLMTSNPVINGYMQNIFIIIHNNNIYIIFVRSYSEFHKGVTFLRRYVRTNEGTKEAINRLLELFIKYDRNVSAYTGRSTKVRSHVSTIFHPVFFDRDSFIRLLIGPSS